MCWWAWLLLWPWYFWLGDTTDWRDERIFDSTLKTIINHFSSFKKCIHIIFHARFFFCHVRISCFSINIKFSNFWADLLCKVFVIFIVIVLFLIPSPKVHIVLSFVKSYVLHMFYHMLVIRLLSKISSFKSLGLFFSLVFNFFVGFFRKLLLKKNK